MDQYNLKQAAYEAEVKRMHGAYGPDAEIPHAPIVGIGTPAMPIAGRIAELAKHVAEVGHQLAEARERYAEASRHKQKCEAAFAEVSTRLLEAIQEHREGTPENVPYRS